MNLENASCLLSTSPTSVNEFEINKRLMLDDFLKELPHTIESILESRESLRPQEDESKADPIAELFRRLHLSPEELSRHAYFDTSKHYTRNLVATDNKHYTLLLLCWNPGRSSPIHDHPCDGCWMQVLKGSVRECRYERNSDDTLECILDCQYCEGQQMYINDSMGYHSVGNPSMTQPAMTLHLYCPPFSSCKIWMNPTSTSTCCKVSYYSQHGKVDPLANVKRI